MWRGEKELQNSDIIGRDHYKLGKESKPIQIVINMKLLTQDIEDSKVSKAKLKLQLAKLLKGSSVKVPKKLENLANDLLEEVAKNVDDIEIDSDVIRKTKEQRRGGAAICPCITFKWFGCIWGWCCCYWCCWKGLSMNKSKFSKSKDKIIRERILIKLLVKRVRRVLKKQKIRIINLNFILNKKIILFSLKKIMRKNKRKIFNKSKNMKENIKKASEFYDKKIHYCVVKGYKNVN